MTVKVDLAQAMSRSNSTFRYLEPPQQMPSTLTIPISRCRPFSLQPFDPSRCGKKKYQRFGVSKASYLYSCIMQHTFLYPSLYFLRKPLLVGFWPAHGSFRVQVLLSLQLSGSTSRDKSAIRLR